MLFVLYRILGNDLPPRHKKGLTFKNLCWVLDREPSLRYCERRFLLNRIWDQVERDRIIARVKEAGLEYEEIPFVEEEYRSCGNVEEQALYLTNQNEARNYCINQGLRRARVVLPFDSGTCFREDGWGEFEFKLRVWYDEPYLIVPMWRMHSYGDFEGVQPRVEEVYWHRGKVCEMALTEPQIVLTKRADCLYMEGMAYGRCNKVDLLWKLGVQGMWDRWSPGLKRAALKRKSRFCGKIKKVSFICKLPSGNKDADISNEVRRRVREEGKEALVRQVNATLGIL